MESLLYYRPARDGNTTVYKILPNEANRDNAISCLNPNVELMHLYFMNLNLWGILYWAIEFYLS